MRCAICKKEGEIVPLFEGIYNAEMIRICEPCAEREGIPMLKKPSVKQLEKAEERYTVRERMEAMSGIRDKTEIGEEQLKIQGQIAKLKMPEKKQRHEEVVDNYYWNVNIARRRKKLSVGQLSREIDIPEKTIAEIEKGKIPKDFEEIFLKLERFLGVKLLKNHKPQVTFKKPEAEEDILAKVKYRMENPGEEEQKEEEDVLEESDTEEVDIDLSRREDFENVTLNDLISRKKRKEIKEKQKKKRIQTDAMVGDDLELDIDEL